MSSFRSGFGSQFSNFKTQFSSQATSYIKRRFGADNLNDEDREEELPPGVHPAPKGPPPPPPRPAVMRPGSGERSGRHSAAGGEITGSDASSYVPPSTSQQQSRAPPQSKTESAPTSPMRGGGFGGFLSRATSITQTGRTGADTGGAVGGPSGSGGGGGGMFGNVMGSVTRVASDVASRVPGVGSRDKQRIILVLDDQGTDWSKYFRGRKLGGEWDLKVEQAELRDLTIATNSETGPTVYIWQAENKILSGAKPNKIIRPDFVLIRQPPVTLVDDFRPILLGLRCGGVPALNSLHSIYNMSDRPWTFSQLIGIQRRLGRDAFPLIEQTYYQTPKELASHTKFPCVVKLGHGHAGEGKIRVESPSEFSDIISLINCTSRDPANQYATVEPYIDAKCDLQVQKIGSNYRAYIRKSISGNWKANTGQAMLESLPVTERYKLWVDEVSAIFNGLDICAVEAIVGKDGKEHIFEATGCHMSLLGESQEDDRRAIADLVVQRMSSFTRPSIVPGAGLQRQHSRTGSIVSQQSAGVLRRPSAGGPAQVPPPLPQAKAPPPPLPASEPPSARGFDRKKSSELANNPFADLIADVKPNTTSNIPSTTPPGPPPGTSGSAASIFSRLTSQISIELDKSTASGSVVTNKADSESGTDTLSQDTTGAVAGGEGGVDEEDTMKNMRKTFAGIFGNL